MYTIRGCPSTRVNSEAMKMSNVSLTVQELQILGKASPEQKCVAYSVVRLYFTTLSGGDWKYSGLSGILGLFGDSRTATWTFILLDPTSGATVWCYKIDPSIQYFKERPNFHCFFGDKKLVGILHAEGFEPLSDSMYEGITTAQATALASLKAPQPQKQQVIDQKRTYDAEQPHDVRVARNISSSHEEMITQDPKKSTTSLRRIESNKEYNVQNAKSGSSKSKSSGGHLWPFFNWGGKKSGSGKERITKDQIGDPMNLKHISHVGFDKVNGFSAHNVSEKWMEILSIAGLSTQHLEANPKLANYTKRFLIKNYDAIAASSKSGPVKVSTPSDALHESLNYSHPPPAQPDITHLREEVTPKPATPKPKPLDLDNTQPSPPRPLRSPSPQVNNLPPVGDDKCYDAQPAPLSRRTSSTIQDKPHQKLRPLPPPPPIPAKLEPRTTAAQAPQISRPTVPPPPPPPITSRPDAPPPVRPPANPMSSMRDNLMKSIRDSGGTSSLKSAKENSIKRPTISKKDTSPDQESADAPRVETTTATIAEALKEALLRRNAAIDPTDSDSDESQYSKDAWL